MISKKARAAKVNADDEAALNRFVKDSRAQAVLCMLPARYGYSVAKAALAAGIAFVSSSYAGDLPRLHERARKAGVSILPEMGFYPGIDLILCGLAVNELDEVHGLYSYGAGLPEPACAGR